MAQIEEITPIKYYELILSEEEAQFLMDYLRNYIGENEEDPWRAEIRRNIFTTLHKKLIKESK